MTPGDETGTPGGTPVRRAVGRAVSRAGGALLGLALLGAMGAGLAGWPAGNRQPAGEARTVRVLVTDGRGTPLPGVALHLDGAPLPTTVTDRRGTATLVLTRRPSALTVRGAGRSGGHAMRVFVEDASRPTGPEAAPSG